MSIRSWGSIRPGSRQLRSIAPRSDTDETIIKAVHATGILSGSTLSKRQLTAGPAPRVSTA